MVCHTTAAAEGELVEFLVRDEVLAPTDWAVGKVLGLHADAGKGLLAEVGEPRLDDLLVSVKDLDGALVSPSPKVLLRLFVDKRRSRDGAEPSRGGQGGGAGGGESEGAGGAEGKVCEEGEVGEGVVVGAEVQGCDVVAVRGFEGDMVLPDGSRCRLGGDCAGEGGKACQRIDGQ